MVLADRVSLRSIITLMLAATSIVLAQEAKAAAPPKLDEALALRLAMIRSYCNASNTGVWPHATDALPCQFMNKRKDLISGSTNAETAKAEASKVIKDEQKKADRTKLSADKKLIYESVCAQGTKFSRWKMCHHPDVRKFMLGPAAAAAAAHASGGGKAKGVKGGGAAGGGVATRDPSKAKGKGKGSGRR